jgi:hypothetical protein
MRAKVVVVFSQVAELSVFFAAAAGLALGLMAMR